jgi:GAF domain-containing protein
VKQGERVEVETRGRCATLLAADGPVAVLSYLNARTRFRFTGLYRAEPPLLRNLHLFDRENPRLNVSGADVPLEETNCAITCAGARPFHTSDARTEARLVAHAACESVLSYGGVPIRLESGVVCGTLCHFDVRPRLLGRGELEVLETVAPLLVPLFAPQDAPSMPRRASALTA